MEEINSQLNKYFWFDQQKLNKKTWTEIQRRVASQLGHDQNCYKPRVINPFSPVFVKEISFFKLKGRTLTLHKISENMGFHKPVFSRIRTESMIRELEIKN